MIGKLSLATPELAYVRIQLHAWSAAWEAYVTCRRCVDGFIGPQGPLQYRDKVTRQLTTDDLPQVRLCASLQ